MTEPLQEATLAPLSELLMRAAQTLEHEVVPHVAGEPYNAAAEVVDQLHRIVRAREAMLARLAAAVALDGVPDYCWLHECQNLATHGPLCQLHQHEWVA